MTRLKRSRCLALASFLVVGCVGKDAPDVPFVAAEDDAPEEIVDGEPEPEEPVEQAEEIFEEPVLQDSEVLGQPDFASDSKAEADSFNDIIGIGGGAGGKFGKRFGGTGKMGGPPLAARAAPREHSSHGNVPEASREAYEHLDENPFFKTADEALSTFSIDVDTASYANVRRFLDDGKLPPPDAVRIEELVNYFSYNWPEPVGTDPFAVTTEVAGCPWNEDHLLMAVGLKARSIPSDQRPPSNLVFLLDVSGSMNNAKKLPLVKEGMQLLADNLTARDRVAIVVYAGSSGLVLPSTPGTDRQAIKGALERLKAGGSTNGGAGIELAYKTAADHFIEGGTNRVILCTDGDFNVGVSDEGSLVRLVEEKKEKGIFLTILGVGSGNLQDSRMEAISNKGDGNYAYIDSIAEARKVLVEEIGGTLVTVAKDVKIQLEFNPMEVEGFRLIGYENRVMAHRDFRDDTKDAGEIGAGHTVTALYEVVPKGVGLDTPSVPDSRYQTETRPTGEALSGELLVARLRYKEPAGTTGIEMAVPVHRSEVRGFDEASADLKHAAAVAGFGMLLRDSEHKGDLTYEAAIELARRGLGPDSSTYRIEFVELVEKASRLAPDTAVANR